MTYTCDDESYILVGIKVRDGRVQCRREGVFEQPSEIGIPQSILHVRNDFLGLHQFLSIDCSAPGGLVGESGQRDSPQRQRS